MNSITKGRIYMRDYIGGLSGPANRINRNLQHKLSAQIRFGESRHDAKQKAREEYLKLHGNLEGYNPSRVEGIFSIKTLEDYRQTAREFSIWAAKQGCNKITKIDRDTC